MIFYIVNNHDLIVQYALGVILDIIYQKNLQNYKSQFNSFFIPTKTVHAVLYQIKHK
jgi:hypothetical protein